VGLKGRTGHRWWVRGERPRGIRQQGYEWAHLFGAVRPATGEGFALVLPEVSTAAMQLFLDRFSAEVPPDAHVALVLDGAGWHVARDLAVPANVTPVPLPAYAPEPAGQRPAAGGAGLAVPAGALPLAPRARRLRGRRGRLLRGVERAHAGASALPHRLPMDHEGRFIGSAV
jgi:DDE superfamily endonuclease